MRVTWVWQFYLLLNNVNYLNLELLRMPTAGCYVTSYAWGYIFMPCTSNTSSSPFCPLVWAVSLGFGNYLRKIHILDSLCPLIPMKGGLTVSDCMKFWLKVNEAWQPPEDFRSLMWGDKGSGVNNDLVCLVL